MAALNYHHLRYFWSVAHDGNLTRTAERLNLSQSALSVQIRKLEDQLGHPLFERRGRQLHLTEAGRIAMEHADAIFAAGAELLATFQHRADGARQVLRVGALATLSRNFQAAFLRPLIGRPRVELVLRSGPQADLLAALEAHRLDVVLLNTAPPRDAATPWIARQIDDHPVSLIGTPERIGQTTDPDVLLRREPVILPTIESSLRGAVDSFLNQRGIIPQIAAEADDMAMIRLLAREDAALAIVPRIVVRDELQAGLLIEAHEFEDLSETFTAVTLERRFPNPLLAELLA